MSVIQRKPFIQNVLETLGNLKADLLDLVNGSDKTPEFRSLINESALITGSDKNKVQYVNLETWAKTYSGYLIYNNSYCVLIAFSSNTQALVMLNINATKSTYTVVKEYLDINELRRYLEESDEHIVPSEIDSTGADKGQVLTADGDGGAEWTDKVEYLVLVGDGGGTLSDDDIALAKQNNTVARYGDGGEMYYKNSQNNFYIVFKATARVAGDDTIVEKLTLDLTEKTWSYSYDVVAAGESFTPTYDDTLNEGSENAVQNKVVTKALETKANVDGNYQTMTVGVADQLSPYDEESGDDQDEPFSFQATGTGNGSQPDFATGTIALMKEKQGNTVVVNQQIQETSRTLPADTYDWGGATEAFSMVNGHKYLIIFSNNELRFRLRNISLGYVGSGADCETQIINFAETTDSRYILQFNGTSTKDTYVTLIDLTQWFNGDIPSDLESHPENFFRYYNGSLAYNVGELVNADGRYIKCIGRNQWDGINDVKAIPNATYYIYGSATLTYKDKDGNTIDSESKTNETFVAPSNCLSVGVSGTGDICISIYYEDESGYDKYYPYQVLTNNDTGTEELRSAGSVKDYKEPDGTITRRVGSVDLGDLSWQDAASVYKVAQLSSAKAPADNNTKANISCDKYNPIARSSTNNDNDIAISSDGYVYIRTTDTPSGTLYYELATPTTEQGTSYSENLVIDDFGSMDFQGTNGVPQGNLIFYPVDYKAFIDTLYDYTEGTPSNIALKSDLTPYDNKDTQLQNAIGGTLRQCLCVKESLDFDNTAFVDLGALIWVQTSDYWRCDNPPTNFKAPASSSSLPKAISSALKIVARTSFITNTIAFNTDNSSWYVNNSSTTEKPSGLLAYEKVGE